MKIPAVTIVAAKKNLRLLSCGKLNHSTASLDFKRVNGGLLVQDRDLGIITENDLKIVTKRKPTPSEINDMLFTWKVAKMVKSNAIVYGKDQRTIGVGAGQMSRVNSARIAAIKAEHANLQVAGSVMASDAFFPFPDCVEIAFNAGVRSVIQPGGSIKDQLSVDFCDANKMSMVFTGIRHFKH